MGLFGGSTTTNYNSTSNISGSRRRVNPAWVDRLGEQFGGEIEGLSKIDPNTLVPGASALQTKAFADAGGLGGLGEMFSGAGEMAAYVGNAAAPRTGFVGAKQYIPDFLDPYQQQVTDATEADLDANAGRVRAQQSLDLAGAGAFGGSGAALTQSMTEGELARARAATLADIRSRGFSQALGAAQNEAGRAQSAKDLNAQLYAGQMDRALNAGRTLTDIAATFGGEKRADAALTAGLGEQQRQIEGERANAIVDFLRTRTDLLSGLPLDIYGGEDTTGTTTTTGTQKSKKKGSLMDAAGTAAQIASLFVGSDETIKRDVSRIGVRPDGLGVYLFRYADKLAARLWGSGWKIGVMAQEVLKVKPQAVATHPAGFLMVDYSQI